MKHKKYILIAILTTFTLSLGTFSLWKQRRMAERVHSPLIVGSLREAAPDLEEPAPEPHMRAAERLVDRLKRRGLPHPGVPRLSQVLSERSELLRKQITLTISAPSREPLMISLSLANHPEWLRLQHSFWFARFFIDPLSVQASIDRKEIIGLPLVADSTVQSVAEDTKHVYRVTTDTTAKAGYELDTVSAAQQIVDALEDEKSEVEIEAAFREPYVTLMGSDGSAKRLTLLSTGLSDFSHSSANRIANVHKAIDERLHNTLVRAGDSFSLVDALDAPITLKKGWKEELGLFGGSAALTPGAGICQAATTLYRAVLLAGLPLVEKDNHSLFVDHYEFFGVGLDATVFPYVQDFRFRNDTPGDIVIQAYTEDETVIVHFFGESDGRTVSLDGPYFTSSKYRPNTLRPVTTHQISWVRTITFADGRELKQPLVSTYAKPIPRSLSRKYGNIAGMKLLVTREGEGEAL